MPLCHHQNSLQMTFVIFANILSFIGSSHAQFFFSFGDSSNTVCSSHADLAFIIDTSRSLGKGAFNRELEFVDKVLDGFEIGPGKTRVAVVTFSAGTRLEFDFNRYSDKEAVQQAIRSIPYTDGTCTLIYRALKQVREEIFVPEAGDRPNFKNVAVFLSDGETNPGRMDSYSLPQAKTLTRKEANRLKFHGVDVYGIGVGHRVDHVEMIGISSGAKNYYRVHDSTELDTQSFIDDITTKICSTCNNKPADIFFMVDKSSSLASQENFDKELSFIARFIEDLNIGTGYNDTRVGVITFSTEAQLEFGLTSYTNTEDLRNGLLDISFTLGNTYTHKAFNILLNQGFSSSPRPVPWIGIIMTDGQSTNPYKLEDVIVQVHRSGIHVFSLGFGNKDEKELRMMASDPDEKHVFIVDDVHTLDSVRDELYLQTCYLIGRF